MLDAINAIVDFINMIIGSVADFLSYFDFLSGFTAVGSGVLNSMLVYVPDRFLPFVLITIALSIVMLVLGRTNAHG